MRFDCDSLAMCGSIVWGLLVVNWTVRVFSPPAGLAAAGAAVAAAAGGGVVAAGAAGFAASAGFAGALVGAGAVGAQAALSVRPTVPIRPSAMNRRREIERDGRAGSVDGLTSASSRAGTTRKRRYRPEQGTMCPPHRSGCSRIVDKIYGSPPGEVDFTSAIPPRRCSAAGEMR